MDMFSPSELATMIELRTKKRMSCLKIAQLMYCDKQTVRRYLEAAGAFRPLHKPANKAMLVHDWNAGVPVDKLMLVYGFASKQSVHSRISRLRRDGWFLKYRSL